jgi:hypothetical protein
MRWLIIYSTVTLAGIMAAMALFWAFGGFDQLGLSFSGVVALCVGILFTSLLGVGLMALVFYSNRSNVDEEVYHPKLGNPDRPDEES